VGAGCCQIGFPVTSLYGGFTGDLIATVLSEGSLGISYWGCQVVLHIVWFYVNRHVISNIILIEENGKWKVYYLLIDTADRNELVDEV
jgi:hypothetical protein